MSVSSQLAGAVSNVAVANDLVEESERQTLVARYPSGGEEQLLCFRCTDKLGEEPARAVVAGQPNVGEGGGYERVRLNEPHITG